MGASRFFRLVIPHTLTTFNEPFPPAFLARSGSHYPDRWYSKRQKRNLLLVEMHDEPLPKPK